MKNFLLSSIITMTALTGFAQVNSTILELQDAKVQINTNGALFNEFGNGMPGYEVPANSGNHAVFFSSLWLSGLDSQDSLRNAAIRFCQDAAGGFCEYFPGPLSTDGTVSSDPAVFDEYNRFWFIDRQQVDTHTAYFTCFYDPNCNTEIQFPEGYTISDEILEWPAHGETALGQPFYLAPFVDVNGDGSYQPEFGDYPSFPGDKAVYMISNDMGGPHVDSYGTPFGIELHTMVYSLQIYWLEKNLELIKNNQSLLELK